jgi:hypothetical protein
MTEELFCYYICLEASSFVPIGKLLNSAYLKYSEEILKKSYVGRICLIDLTL